MASNTKIENMAEVFQMLESNNPEIVKEIQQLIYEQYQEVKESWLVSGLYDAYCQSGSARCLQLLLDVRDPHERFLLDKISEGLKQQDKPRLTGLTVLGYVIRKQPSWLYKITQHALMKELIKILKTEDDIVIMMNGLLDLLALMPILPVHTATYLQDLFEVFSRVASWRYQCVKGLPEIQKVHLQVGLYAFFHRLYGMFPCNFLSYLRTQYSDNNKDNQAVFVHTIRPMLNSVTMHPLLVTHSRDLEKSAGRWKKMELHDVIVESSRYSLVSQENGKEEDIATSLDIDVGSYASSLKPQSTDMASGDPHGLFGSATHDPLWTPARKFDISTPPPGVSSIISSCAPATVTVATITPGVENTVVPLTIISNLGRPSHDSPPEAAIEATPETTPFVTPIKDDKFKFARPAPSSQVSRHLRLDVGNYRSPLPLPNGGVTSTGPASAGITSAGPKPSPSKEPFPFRFPEAHHQLYERRDSLFFDKTPTDAFPPKGTPATTSSNNSTSSATLTSTTSQGTANGSSVGGKDSAINYVAVSSSVLLANVQPEEGSVKKLQSQNDRRPSPIKFTSQRPKQFPIQPKPERLPAAVTDAVKHKMLSLENLKDSLPDFGREEDDDEVTEITGGSDNRPNDLSTRHITPMMYTDSANTSRTVSRLSSSSQADDPRKSDCSVPSRPTTSTDVSRLAVIDITSTKVASVTSPAASSDCKSGGLHPPSRDTVNDFVRQIRGRIRYASLCGSATGGAGVGPSGMPAEIAAEVDAVMNSETVETADTPSRSLRRSSSCPDARQLLSLLKKSKISPDESPDSTGPLMLPDANVSLVSANHATSSVRQPVDDNVKRFYQDQPCQTDAFLVYPYEHLFPSALPNWFAQVNNAAKCEKPSEPSQESVSTTKDVYSKTENPYEILDQFVRSACLSALEGTAAAERAIKFAEIDSPKVLKEEIALLHSTLLYERHRRETLGMRNRRLLGKTRSSRILEEQNTALVDQLQIVESEIAQLFSELETLRRQKHEVEAERAENDKQRDKEIEQLMSENKSLKQQKFDFETKSRHQKDEIESATSEITRLEAALFNAKSEIDRLSKKEESRLLAERELFHLRKEVLLLGELLRKYREKDLIPREESRQQDVLQRNAAKQQINSLQVELSQKVTETEAYKARVHELEHILAMKDEAMNDQKWLLKKVKEEYEKNQKNSESSYTTLMKTQYQLEIRILELQDQLSKALRGNRKPRANVSPARGVRGMSGIIRGAGASASMNIELPPHVTTGSSGGSERTFTVGSPPSSSGGSCGSDRSEMIRQGLEGGIAIRSRSPPDLEGRSVNGNVRR